MRCTDCEFTKETIPEQVHYVYCAKYCVERSVAMEFSKCPEEKDVGNAIEILEDNQTYLKGDAHEWVYALAISALKNQSEAKKKIEKAREKIEQLRNDYKSLDSAEHVVMDYVADTILDILEGKE